MVAGGRGVREGGGHVGDSVLAESLEQGALGGFVPRTLACVRSLMLMPKSRDHECRGCVVVTRQPNALMIIIIMIARYRSVSRSLRTSTPS